jgi:hypothetical protein
MKNLCFITIASIICLSCSNKPEGYISYDNIKTISKKRAKTEIIDVKKSNPISEEDFLLYIHLTLILYNLTIKFLWGQSQKLEDIKNAFIF